MTEANPGFKAGIGQGTRSQRLGWALKGATVRTKDLRLNAIGGIAEGRKLRDKVTRLMLDAKVKGVPAPLNPEDAIVACVFAEPDLSSVAIINGVPDAIAFLPVTNGAADLELARKFVGKLPVGFMVFVLDAADAERHVFGHTRPLIVEDGRAVKMMDDALKVTTNKIKSRMGLVGEN